MLDDPEGGAERDRGVRRRADPGLPGGRRRCRRGRSPAASASCWTRSSPPDDPLPYAVRGRARPDRARRRRCARSTGRRAGRSLGAARKRLKWDEAFAVQLTLVQRKARAADSPATPRPRRPGRRAGAVRRSAAVRADRRPARGRRRRSRTTCASTHPMHRLLQGEVGSGKTLCALRAMLQVVDAGGQAAMLAPTEVLATQHFRSISALLGPLGRAGELDGDPDGTRVALLTGSLSARGPARRRWPRSLTAAPASSSARTRCSTRASTSPTSGWSWSTSSTGSASSSATRCGPRPTSRRTCW